MAARQTPLLQELDAESLAAFNEACQRPFSDQAVFFLNAFWAEHGDQAEFIYSIAWYMIQKADKQAKGINYAHLYEEGCELDFDMGLYFFEHLVKFSGEPGSVQYVKDLGTWVSKNPSYVTEFKTSIPAGMTAITRKKAFKEEVDVNADGKISMLEFLCYQYRVSPKDLMDRATIFCDEPEEVRKARLALLAVSKQIQLYEAEKSRLTAMSLANGGRGVRALGAKNMLAQLNCGPLWEKLQAALITAEAAVRIAIKLYGVGSGTYVKGDPVGPSMGGVWWMSRDLAEKKARYGRVTL